MSARHRKGGAAYGPAYQRLRRAVLERDGWRCQQPDCGRRGRLEVHHIRPLESGGTNDLGNLQTLCRACHLNIHAKPVSAEKAAWGALVWDMLA